MYNNYHAYLNKFYKAKEVLKAEHKAHVQKESTLSSPTLSAKDPKRLKNLLGKWYAQGGALTREHMVMEVHTGTVDLEKEEQPLYLPLSTNPTAGFPFVSRAAAQKASVPKVNIFIWGSGQTHQQGTGHMRDELDPQEVRGVSLEGSMVADCALGSMHTLVLCETMTEHGHQSHEDSCLYSFGWGGNGILGCGSQIGHMDPRPLPYFKDRLIIKIAAGDEHCAAIGAHGEVYTWGCGLDYRLGHGNQITMTRPRQVNTLTEFVRVVSVACGQKNTAFVSDKGLLFTCGSSDHGVHGHGNGLFEPTPRPINDFLSSQTEHVASPTSNKTRGVSFEDNDDDFLLSQAVGDEDLLDLACKVNDKYQIPTSSMPIPRKGLNVVSVTMNSCQMFAVMGDGSLYTWGRNKDAPAPLVLNATTDEDQLVPALAKDFKKMNVEVKQVDCGELHCVVLSTTGNVYTWGMGLFGQLGRDEDFSAVPKKVPAFDGNVTEIASGVMHCLAVVNKETLYSWGSNTEGQLGLGTRVGCRVPKKVNLPVEGKDSIVKVGAGACQSFAICMSGTHCDKYSKLKKRASMSNLHGHQRSMPTSSRTTAAASSRAQSEFKKRMALERKVQRIEATEGEVDMLRLAQIVKKLMTPAKSAQEQEEERKQERKQKDWKKKLSLYD